MGGIMTLDLVIFDLDGTLVDSRRDLERAVNATLRELGKPELGRSEVEAAIGHGVSRLLERTLGGRDLLVQARPVFDRHYETGLLLQTRPYPGLDDLIPDLAAHRTLAVATNKPGIWARRIVAGLGWSGYFQAVMGGGDVARLKPAPDMIEALLEHPGREGNRAVFVGDMDVDIQAARAAGLRSIGVSWGLTGRAGLETAGADWVVDDADGLRALLGELGVKKCGSRGRSQEGGV
jgi:phosphoglycolate phosphatase